MLSHSCIFRVNSYKKIRLRMACYCWHISAMSRISWVIHGKTRSETNLQTQYCLWRITCVTCAVRGRLRTGSSRNSRIRYAIVCFWSETVRDFYLVFRKMKKWFGNCGNSWTIRLKHGMNLFRVWLWDLFLARWFYWVKRMPCLSMWFSVH